MLGRAFRYLGYLDLFDNLFGNKREITISVMAIKRIPKSTFGFYGLL